MIPSIVQKQISSSLVREGQLFKRSKFLKVWQDKWLVLTVNYLFIFQDRNKRVLNDSIDLNQIKNYKSYIRKEDDILTTCLKIRSDSNMYYLGFGSVLEKWTWVVTLERLMDMKVLGKSQYNAQEWITTKGFPSQAEFQGVSREKQKEDTLAKEVEKLKRQLEEQEKFFENALKQKYKELNVIEDKMKQREKHYAQLNVKLNAALKDAEAKVAEAETKVKQAQLKIQDAENRIKISIEKFKSLQQSYIKHKKEIKNELPPLNHEIKSFYQHQMVESMLGFSLTSQQSANLALRTIIINEGMPKVQAKKQLLDIPVIFGSEKISEVQSILGYTIPPAQHTSIHTQGLIKAQQVKQMVAEIVIDAIIIDQLKEEINGLRAQLQKANQKIIQLSFNKIDKKDEYTHSINQSHKFALVESILGYALSPSAHSTIHIKSKIIKEDDKVAKVTIQKIEQIPQNDARNNIQAVQSILGYSITPAQLDSIHTDGPIAQKEEVFEQQKYTERDNQMLKIRIESLQQQLAGKDRELANLKYKSKTVQRQGEQIIIQNQRLRKELHELRLQLENVESMYKDQIAQNNQFLEHKDEMIIKLQAEILLLKQLLKENNEVQQDKQLNASPALPLKIEYRPTGHQIKSSYQFQIIESMLGHSLPQAQRKNAVLNTVIIQQEKPKIIKQSARQERRDDNEHIVQTVLGFSIPPTRSHQIHTGGKVQERILLRVFDALKQEVELLKQQLNASEAEIQRLKISNIPKIEVARTPLPETGHILRPSFRFEIAETMIGSSLSSEAKQNLHIRANFIQDEPFKHSSLKYSNNNKSERKDNSKVDAVQTILGYAIPPLRYTEIHTEGIVPVKIVKANVKEQENDLALDIMMLNEKIINLVANGQGLKQESDILRAQLSKQKNQYQTLKEFNESTVKQAQKAYTQSERVKKLLEEKIVIEQALNKQIKQQTERLEQQQKQRTKHIESEAILTAQIVSLKVALTQIKQSIEAQKVAKELSKVQKEEKSQAVEKQQPKESIKEEALKAEINLLMLKIVKEQAKVHQITAQNDKLKEQIKRFIENEAVLRAQVQCFSKKVKEHELNSISKQQYEEQKRQLEELFKRNKQLISQRDEIIASLETEIKLLKENSHAKDTKTTASIQPKKQLPSTNHTIRSVYQIQMVESMLGFVLPRNQQEKVTLKTTIIVEQHSRIIENITKMSDSNVKSPKNSNDESIQSVESVLGFSIPPSKSKQIHVGGKIEQNAHKREVEVLRKQLALAEAEIDRLKVNNASKNDKVRVPLLETGHTVRPGYKIGLVQSMLGFSLSSDAKKNMYIRANYIDDEPKQYPAKQLKNNVETKKERNGNVDAVETILGFAIPPFRQIEIHTDGIIPIKQAKVEINNKSALANEQLNQQLLALKTSNKLLKQQIQAVQKAFSLQTELFQAEKSRLADTFLQSQARHLQIQQDLAIKLKQYQDLYSQFETKYNDIQSQPIVISPKKEQKQSENIVTDILKPSLLKAKSNKNQNVPVWVKVRPEEQQQIEKPAQITKKQSETQSPLVRRVSKVSQMKKLFEQMSSKKQ